MKTVEEVLSKYTVEEILKDLQQLDDTGVWKRPKWAVELIEILHTEAASTLASVAYRNVARRAVMGRNDEHNMDYLLGEIAVDGPEERARYMTFNKLTEETCDWPKDFYAVSDDREYVAFFRHEEDAFGFRLWMINNRLNGRKQAMRHV